MTADTWYYRWQLPAGWLEITGFGEAERSFIHADTGRIATEQELRDEDQA